MKILIDLQHPAHLHVFRNAVERWRAEGHEVLITGRDKDILVQLAEETSPDLGMLDGVGNIRELGQDDQSVDRCAAFLLGWTISGRPVCRYGESDQEQQNPARYGQPEWNGYERFDLRLRFHGRAPPFSVASASPTTGKTADPCYGFSNSPYKNYRSAVPLSLNSGRISG